MSAGISEAARAPRVVLRRPIGVALAVTLALTAAALLRPAPAPEAPPRPQLQGLRSEASPQQDRRLPVQDPPWTPSVPSLATIAGNPTAASASPAATDPFTEFVPSSPATPMSAPLAPPPPSPPPFNYHFVGRMTGPDGVTRLYLTRGDDITPIEAGTSLDNGYVVEAISQNNVTFIFPQLAVRMTLPLPPANER